MCMTYEAKNALQVADMRKRMRKHSCQKKLYPFIALQTTLVCGIACTGQRWNGVTDASIAFWSFVVGIFHVTTTVQRNWTTIFIIIKSKFLQACVLLDYVLPFI